MLRATVWTVGLFGVGTAISRLYPGTWMEPLVLLALGIALLFASARTARGTAPTARRAHAPMPDVAQVAAKVAASKAPSPAAVAAAVRGGTVQVERSA